MQRTQDARRTGAAVAALVTLVVLAAAFAGSWHAKVQVPGMPTLDIAPPAVPTPGPDPTPVAGAGQQHGVPAWVPILSFLLLLTIGYVLVRARRWLRRGITADGPEADEPVVDRPPHELAMPALRDAIVEATRLLDDAEVPPGDAVVAAWVALEEAAARSEVVRDRAETATEFTVDVLGSTMADPAATRRLLGLYLQARYSEHAVTGDEVAAAREALVVLADGVRHVRVEERP
ncbi:DUF4129 domain-containing protein [Cellulomonas edaphi]|uniref:DUF4129 domain-containing protein n=1 Tax=Cellulomonas edaphi TaxID=3053468 RepID=A0ABT7S323_9CELL|nr:DUF4129 domain-containing protein [Cellulomons edaphi]MDM7830015.1 DUF4129 domain-containing protein [Cellulomons edaphi]